MLCLVLFCFRFFFFAVYCIFFRSFLPFFSFALRFRQAAFGQAGSAQWFNSTRLDCFVRVRIGRIHSEESKRQYAAMYVFANEQKMHFCFHRAALPATHVAGTTSTFGICVHEASHFPTQHVSWDHSLLVQADQLHVPSIEASPSDVLFPSPLRVTAVPTARTVCMFMCHQCVTNKFDFCNPWLIPVNWKWGPSKRTHQAVLAAAHTHVFKAIPNDKRY